jgi:CRP/FNR family transcriptional regulator, cyclic AMP receptor protein
MSLSSDPAPFDILQWLPKEARIEFNATARRRRCVRGELIYSQGEPGSEMFRLVSGAVRLSVTRSDGRELLYLLFEPGDCFGVSTLIDGDARPHTAEAGKNLELQVLGRTAFNRLRAGYREFDDALLRLVTRHMRLLSGFVSDANLQDISARVASRIVAAARSFGKPCEAGIELAISLSQAELGLMVGGARQTVNRVLRQFQRDGLLSVRNGRLVIHSLEGLRARAS